MKINKEDKKEVLYFFGIGLLLYLLSVGVQSDLFVWLFKWSLKIFSGLFLFFGVITVINMFIAKKPDSDDNTNSQ
jgi:hypothetical protein